MPKIEAIISRKTLKSQQDTIDIEAEDEGDD